MFRLLQLVELCEFILDKEARQKLGQRPLSFDTGPTVAVTADNKPTFIYHITPKLKQQFTISHVVITA